MLQITYHQNCHQLLHKCLHQPSLEQATPSSTPLKQDSPLKMSSTSLKHPAPSCSVLSTVKVENVKRSLGRGIWWGY